MNYILLSGGSGTRLWPLSNDVRAKQFLKIFKSEDGTKESMIQRMYHRILRYDNTANICIATQDNQVSEIKSELGTDINISIEPTRRDTFPAIVLASAYLVKHVTSEDEQVVVCPVDSLVDDDFYKTITSLSVGDKNVTLLGIKPSYPCEKYGYMLDNGSSVSFFEKPNIDKANEYIENGALWNAGVFCFKILFILDIAKRIIGFNDYDSIYNNYDKLEKISFDYAVLEKENSIKVVKYDGSWKDIGTWDTFSEAINDNVSGNAKLVDSNNSHIINELSLPILCIGVDNAIVAATPDGILVADKNKSVKIKDYIEKTRPMYEKRAWGEYKVLDYQIHGDGNNSLTKELIIKPGNHISYQVHKHRTEMWTFIEGEGILIVDDGITKVCRGDAITINPGVKHAIKGITELHIIEVQLGDQLVEEDIERLDFDWEKV